MSISDILISFIISLVTGILSGVLLTSKGNSDRPTIIQIQQNITKKEYRITQQEPKSSYNSSDNNIVIFIIVFIVIFISTVTFFAKHRDIIIIWGWRTIAFGSSVVVTSMIVSFIKESRIEFAGVWTFISWIAIIYTYWIFCNPNLDGYILYLEEVGKGKNVDFNDYSIFAFDQTLGLILLIIVSAYSFILSISFVLWPVGYRNKFLYSLCTKLARLYSPSLLVLHTILILLSYLYCRGFISKLFSNGLSKIIG